MFVLLLFVGVNPLVTEGIKTSKVKQVWVKSELKSWVIKVGCTHGGERWKSSIQVCSIFNMFTES